MFLAAFVLWAVYGRYRRTVGRQRIDRGRMLTRITILGVLGVGLAATLAMTGLVALAEGLLAFALGLAAALYGLRLTRFESIPGGDFYTPNRYLGLAVFGVFLARLAYKFVALSSTPPAANSADANPFAAYGHGPLVLAPLFLLVGYYVTYYAGVLLAHRNRARREGYEA
jgi:uncharacterized membrane protein YidH (DUF202 family)